MTSPLTTRNVADKLGTDPKTLRVFLRATKVGVGARKRYEFTGKDVASLKARFAKWRAEREAANATPPTTT